MTDMYRVMVEFCGTNSLYVQKYVQKVRVISIGTKYAIVSPWPEFYGRIANTKIPRSQLHVSLDSAQQAADKEAAVLVGRLEVAVQTLKAPAAMKDTTHRLQGI